ncbi:DNA (cytosine-5-)-methyltransferase [Neisseria bacilliformis ATCC BAA-1200]|uniref:DNA (Cytosine-5-)-methyltransferase n=1 Tax=Neisseria bacilliformis ATCC BAA-1200 TaxID=888742 RepID=F2BA15_9NEIS|nr:DNA (cytosine-5-)-methyltransferase [Neisseria bacilliformis ATCC BAA-1200]
MNIRAGGNRGDCENLQASIIPPIRFANRRGRLKAFAAKGEVLTQVKHSFSPHHLE